MNYSANMKAGSYLTYGLVVQSVILLQEVQICCGTPDVVVALSAVQFPPVAHLVESCVRTSKEETRLYWPDVGSFLIIGGRQIVIDPAPDVEECVLRLFLLGPALAILLHQRGHLVLHASAVSVGGQAIAFLGGSGWGKSTIAAVLHARGYGVVTDDVLAADVTSGNPIVYSGFPQLKLWPEAAAILGEASNNLQRVYPQCEKRAYPAARGFSTTPLPLSCLYVLSEGACTQVEDLAPQNAFVELIRHTYTARLLDSHRTRSHFLQCANLAAKVPIRRLVSPRSLAALPNLANLVEKDLAAIL